MSTQNITKISPGPEQVQNERNDKAYLAELMSKADGSTFTGSRLVAVREDLYSALTYLKLCRSRELATCTTDLDYEIRAHEETDKARKLMVEFLELTNPIEPDQHSYAHEMSNTEDDERDEKGPEHD